MRTHILLVIMVFSGFLFGSGNIYAKGSLQQETKTITGTVKDGSNNQTLPGVSILIKGTSKGTITDMNGNYSIQASPNDVLVFSFVGYLTENVKVGDQTKINVSLAQDIVGLDKVVVIGYGSQKKSDLTGAISSVSAKDLQSVPVTNTSEALEGRAAGVNVMQSSGMPGASTDIQIRGVSSINGFQPLVVIDGIPGGNLDDISPSDIQSIEVLKDAASAAIYGSSGGNGVILVTTKSGHAGKITTTVNTYTGLQQITRTIPLMNTQQWTQFYADFSKRTVAGQTIYKPFIFSQWSQYGYDSTVNTNWQKALYRKAPISDAQINISGGTEKSHYSVNTEYLKQLGIIKNTGYRKLLVSIGSNTELSKHINLDAKVYFSNSKTTGPAQWQYQNVYNNFTSFDALSELPFLTPYDKNGKWSIDHVANSANPFVGVDERSDQYVKNSNVQGNVALKVNFLKGFNFTSRLSGSLGNTESWNFQPVYSASIYDYNNLNQLTQNWNKSNGWTFQNYLTYNKTIHENHNISIMAGMEASQWGNYFMNGVRQRFNSEDPNLLYFTNASDDTSINQIVQGSAKEARSLAYFGRVDYNYKGLILVQGDIRRDGESNFGPNNRWGDFYSGSFGFKFSDLQAVKNWGFLNFGKLRVSVGQSGQFPVTTYWPYASTILNVDYMNYAFNGTSLTQGMGPVQIPNPDLHWETVTSTDIGLDLGFFGNQLNASIDYFIKQNKDMIMAKQVNDVAGTYIYQNGQGAELGNTGIQSTYPLVNYGSVKNDGLELTASYKKVLGDLQINISGNFTYQKNKITKMAPGSDSTVQGSVHDLTGLTISKVGQPIGEFHGLQFAGIFKQGDKMVYNAKSNRMVFADQPYTVSASGDTTYAQYAAKAGDAKWADLNHDGQITTADYAYLGTYIPPVVYGFSLGLDYKGFDLSAFFQGVYGNKIFNGVKRYLYTWETPTNHGADFANRYHLPIVYNGVTIDPGNLTSNMPELGAQNWGKPSSLYIESGSYLRLKTLTLGYTLPKSWTDKVNIQRFRIYFLTKNLLTVTKYSGYDPEVPNSDPKLAGIDVSGYPKTRQYILGVNVTF